MGSIDYKIVRSRRKTLALGVDRCGKVVVRAPYGVSVEYIEGFVARHTAWINKRLAAVANKPQLDLSDGAILTLFGTNYIVASGRSRVQGNLIFLPAEDRAKALTRFLKRFSREVMELLTARIAQKYGYRYASVRISSARGRWGSCSAKGVVSYTFRVAFLPPLLCEYVAVHELCHTVCFDHSPAFWREVERVLPDWKTRRKALKSSVVMEYL